MSEAGDAHRRVRGLLGAPDAVELVRGLHAPALDELVVVDLDLDARRAEVVREEQREVGRDDGALDVQLARGAQAHLGLDREPVQPSAIRSSWPSACGSIVSIPCGVTLCASSTETVAARRPLASRYRNGSPMPAGISWNSVAESSGAP